MDRFLIFILVLVAVYVMSIMYIAQLDNAESVLVENLADAVSDRASEAMADSIATYDAIGKKAAAAGKEPFITSADIAAQNTARGDILSKSTGIAVNNTITDFEKIMQLSSMGESVTIPAEVKIMNSLKISSTNSKGQANKFKMASDAQNAADGSGEIYADATSMSINGMGQKGKSRVVNLNDAVKVGASLDTPLVRLNGINAFDFTSDGALRINPAGTNAFKNVRVDSGLSANGALTGNTLCVGDSKNCLNNDNVNNIRTIPALSSKIDGQYLTMENAVKKATKDMEDNLGSKCSALNRAITGSGLQVPGPDLYMAPVGGRHGGGNAYNGGRALVHDNGNVLTVNYNNDFAGVNIQSSANVAGNLNVGGRIYFSDSMMRSYPDWWANGSDPYYLQKVTYGANNNHLRLTINDDGDESFQIWGNSCAVGGCQGDGHFRHGFWANGDVHHTRNVYIDGGLWSNGFHWRSDERLKEDIKKLDASDMIEKIKRLDGFKYKLKADQKQHYGVIAQMIEKEFPEMVTEDKDGMKSVEYTQLIPVLMETVKLVNDKADAATSQLKAMKAAKA